MAQVLNVGTVLDRKYRIEKILGQGGFGITYLVTDLGLDKLRALKEFFPKDLCVRGETTSQVMCSNPYTAELVERLKAKFLKEARNIANLDRHNGIVKIQTVFEENDTAYYVMDYIEGESLLSLVKREGPLPVEQAVKYIREVGEALEYVHSHHINHLDVKPANIMVRREDDKAILIDFGLSKQYDSEGHQTSTTPTGISHGFAPMEQYREGGVREFSPQTDLYSLAATLYYLISGEMPPHSPELIESKLTFSSSFPKALQKVIEKAMSPSRQNRHESVKQFLDSLQDIENLSQLIGKVDVVERPIEAQTLRHSETEQDDESDGIVSSEPYGTQYNTIGPEDQDNSTDLDSASIPYQNNQVDEFEETPPVQTKRPIKINFVILILCLIIIGVMIALVITYNNRQNKRAKDRYNTEIEYVNRTSDGTLVGENSLEYKILSEYEFTAEISKAPEDIEGTVVIPSQIEVDGETYDVISIGNNTFMKCEGLTGITIPNSITTIGEYAFLGCLNLSEITIPNSVTSIGDCAFFNCSSLSSITIPNSVTSIGESTFEACDNLTSIIIPGSVTSIGNSAFASCISLSDITIPNSVITIGEYAFFMCNKLNSITIPNSVISIGDQAFYYCENLKQVTIPTRFKDEVNNIFRNCPNLKPINYTE